MAARAPVDWLGLGSTELKPLISEAFLAVGNAAEVVMSAEKRRCAHLGRWIDIRFSVEAGPNAV